MVMPDNPYPDAVEAVARAIWADTCGNRPFPNGGSARSHSQLTTVMNEAKAAITAYEQYLAESRRERIAKVVAACPYLPKSARTEIASGIRTLPLEDPE